MIIQHELYLFKDFEPEQRIEDAGDERNELTTLLKGRRRNANALKGSEGIDNSEASNQARRAKIWVLFLQIIFTLFMK